MIPDLNSAVWRKSSRSSGQGGNCLEMACTPIVRVVRDSKNPMGGVLAFETDQLATFLAAVKAGRFGD